MNVAYAVGDGMILSHCVQFTYIKTKLANCLCCELQLCFSVKCLPEMLQCESFKRRMMAVMSLEVICLANDEYWQNILDAGDINYINYLFLSIILSRAILYPGRPFKYI